MALPSPLVTTEAERIGEMSEVRLPHAITQGEAREELEEDLEGGF